MIDYFKSYFDKIKNTKTLASSSGVNWYISLFNSLLITVGISSILSQAVWYLLDSLQTNQIYQPYYMSAMWELSSFSLIIFNTIILFTIQHRIIEALIKLNSYLNKLIFKGISRFDLWYWKRYRKESILTNNIFKIQNKYMSRSKKQKKIINFAFVICLGMYYVATWIY